MPQTVLACSDIFTYDYTSVTPIADFSGFSNGNLTTTNSYFVEYGTLRQQDVVVKNPVPANDLDDRNSSLTLLADMEVDGVVIDGSTFAALARFYTLHNPDTILKLAYLDFQNGNPFLGQVPMKASSSAIELEGGRYTLDIGDYDGN